MLFEAWYVPSSVSVAPVILQTQTVCCCLLKIQSCCCLSAFVFPDNLRAKVWQKKLKPRDEGKCPHADLSSALHRFQGCAGSSPYAQHLWRCMCRLSENRQAGLCAFLLTGSMAYCRSLRIQLSVIGSQPGAVVQ